MNLFKNFKINFREIKEEYKKFITDVPHWKKKSMVKI